MSDRTPPRIAPSTEAFQPDPRLPVNQSYNASPERPSQFGPIGSRPEEVLPPNHVPVSQPMPPSLPVFERSIASSTEAFQPDPRLPVNQSYNASPEILTQFGPIGSRTEEVSPPNHVQVSQPILPSFGLEAANEMDVYRGEYMLVDHPDDVEVPGNLELTRILPSTEVNVADTCVICDDTFTEESCVRELPCRHNFHNECVVNWLQANPTCPLCRCNVL